MVAVVVEMKGVATLLASVYMPTGLDFLGDSHASCLLAAELYTELLRWTKIPCGRKPIARVVVMGDLNETVAARDRVGGVAAAHPNRFLTHLADAGYLDGYRARHKAGGLTFARAGVLVSRLDYVMVRGLDGGERAVTAAVVVRPPVRTPHHAVLVSLAGVWSPLRSYPLVRPRQPNLRRATPTQITRMVEGMEEVVVKHHDIGGGIGGE